VLTAADLAGRIGAELVGDGGLEVAEGSGLEEAEPGTVSFYANKRYRRYLEGTRASAVIVDATVAAELGERPYARLVHPNPYGAFARALALLHPETRPAPGIDPRAIVEDGAQIDETATVSAMCYVSAGARIGPRTVILPHAFIGEDVQIGADCFLQAGAIVREGCILGDRVRFQPRVTIGADGFGYALDTGDDGKPLHRKVPQVGIVRIEDDVEIGAGACIDRATTGETVVGRGTKIDNLVQVGHNVTIGELTILCGQTGIAGSAVIGNGVVLAGQAGVVGHLTVGDGVTMAAKSGIVGDVEPGAVIAGYPAIPHKVWLRAMAALKELPGLLKRVRRIERRLSDHDGDE